MQRGSTVNFHMENSKDLTYFSCMLVLKLFTLLFTIDAERINSLCMWKGDCFCMLKGDHLCTWIGDCPCEWKGNHLCWSSGVDPGGLMINAERINSQLSHGKFKRFNLFLLHVGIKTVYITVYNWHREDQQSLHVKRWSLASACEKVITSAHEKAIASVCVKVIASVDPGDWWSMQRGSTVNFHMKNSKEFNLFLLHVGIKTVYITVYNWHREDQQSLHVKRWCASVCITSAHEKVITSTHEKVIASASEKVIASVDPGDWWLMQRGSTVNFHMKNSKDLTYFCCMLVLKLYITV